MNDKYTAEQIESAIRGFAGYSATHHGIGNDLLAIAVDYATLLRERESAKAGVSDDDVCDAMTVMFGNHWKPHTDEYSRMRAVLEDFAPMLASARVPDASWFEATLCEARNKWAEQCEVDWLETDNNHPDEWMGKYIRDALLADAPMLASAQQPIPMILHCPSCRMQHIDNPELAPVTHEDGSASLWDNPPHRSHLCHNCGTVWRPADVPTVGVENIQTKGKADKIVPAQEKAEPVTSILRDVCEMDPANPDDPGTVCILAVDLHLILERYIQCAERVRVPDETKDAQRYRLIRSGKSGLPLPLGNEALDIYLDMKLKTAPKPEKE